MRFIDLKRGEDDVSTLAISSKRSRVLTVLGNLPHGCTIAPRTVEDARKLIDWCETWIEAQDLTEGVS